MLKLANAYVAERRTVDELVAGFQVPHPAPTAPRRNIHGSTHCVNFSRAYQQTPDLDPPLPRWTGVQQRQQEDDVNRRASLLRKRRLTGSEQAELERLDEGRMITPPVSITTVREAA